MNWQENLQTLDKLTTKEKRAICESEIVLDFMQTEVFTRLVKLRNELIEQGLIVTLAPNYADDINLPDALVEISVIKTVGDTLKYSAKFYRVSGLSIECELDRKLTEPSVSVTIGISLESISLLEGYLKDFQDNFL